MVVDRVVKAAKAVGRLLPFPGVRCHFDGPQDELAPAL